MNRDIFDGLEDIPRKLESDSYVPGKNSDLYDLARKSVYFYFEKGVQLCDPFFSSEFEKQIHERLIELELQNGQDFLDTIMGILSIDATPLEVKTAGLIFNPVLNALYAAGFMDFRLDMRQFSAAPKDIAHNVKGEPGKPLSLECHIIDSGESVWVANYSKHISMHTYGVIAGVASFARDSEFILEDPVDFIGYAAGGCVFTLPNASDVRPVLIEFVDEYGDDRVRYRLEMKWHGKNWMSFVEGNFFTSGNTIKIPDGKGEWQEVQP